MPEPEARAEELATRVARDGFALLRGLLPAEELASLRGEILVLCRDHGWLREGAPLEEGIAADHIAELAPVLGVGISQQAYQALQRMECFHRLGHHPALLERVAELVGAGQLVHPQKIARVMLPAQENAPTPAHQDYVFVQGCRETYTCWVPLSDCPRALGTLSLLSGSHRIGVLPMEPARGAGRRRALLPSDRPGSPAEGNGWIDWDLHAGDVVVFHSMCVHRSLPNTTRRIRLSVDYRYQSAREPVCEEALHPHGRILDWEEIYAGWRRADLQYYWRDCELQAVARDESLLRTVQDA